MQETTGTALMLERRALKVRQYQVAQQMGIDKSNVSRLESRPVVTPEQAQAYRDALARCVATATEQVA